MNEKQKRTSNSNAAIRTKAKAWNCSIKIICMNKYVGECNDRIATLVSCCTPEEHKKRSKWIKDTLIQMDEIPVVFFWSLKAKWSEMALPAVHSRLGFAQFFSKMHKHLNTIEATGKFAVFNTVLVLWFFLLSLSLSLPFSLASLSNEYTHVQRQRHNQSGFSCKYYRLENLSQGNF